MPASAVNPGSGGSLGAHVSEGVLAFPATAFTATGGLDEAGFAAHIGALAGFKPAAIVPAGGAGEIFSLSLAEHRAHRRDRGRRAPARSPVIAGAGQGIANADRDGRAGGGGGGRGRAALPALSDPARAGRARGLCRGGLPRGLDPGDRLQPQQRRHRRPTPRCGWPTPARTWSGSRTAPATSRRWSS